MAADHCHALCSRIPRSLLRALWLCGCILSAAARAASAQATPPARPDSTPVTVLAPVTVTGQREKAVAPPVATVEVSTEAVQRAPATNAYDLIGRSAGIEVHQQGQGPGFASNVVIGGFTSDHSSDVLLVLDGVAINLPIHGHVEGYADWSILSPGVISTTRVIHGPASVLYGDFSLGGVVEVYTAADAAGAAGSLGVTTFGDVRGWATTGYRHEQSGALVSLSGQREQGWRENADYWLGNGVLRGWRALGKGRLEGGLYAYGSTWNSPGYVSVDDYNDGNLTAAADTTDGGDAQRYIGTLRYGVPLSGRTSLETQLWGQLGNSTVFLTLPEDGVLGQTAERDDREAFGLQAQVNHATDDGEFSVGIGGRADWTTYTLDETDERVAVGASQGNEGRYQALGMFVRWRGMLGTRFLYDLGLRGDLVDYHSLNTLDSLADWQEATDPAVSPKIGASYLVSDKLRVLGSLAHGFRGPIGVIADPSRPLVTAWAAEVGAEYNSGPLQLGVSFFQFNTANERIKNPVTLEIEAAGTTRRRGVSAQRGAGSSAPGSRSRPRDHQRRRGDWDRRAGERVVRPRLDPAPAAELPRRAAPAGRRRPGRLPVLRAGRRRIHPSRQHVGLRAGPVHRSLHADRRAGRHDPTIRRRGPRRLDRGGSQLQPRRGPAERVRRQVPGDSRLRLHQPRRAAQPAGVGALPPSQLTVFHTSSFSGDRPMPVRTAPRFLTRLVVPSVLAFAAVLGGCNDEAAAPHDHTPASAKLFVNDVDVTREPAPRRRCGHPGRGAVLPRRRRRDPRHGARSLRGAELHAGRTWHPRDAGRQPLRVRRDGPGGGWHGHGDGRLGP